ncbi:MAG: hypothetical protein LBU74_02475 [Methanobacteriaceae archaeon]|jgi:hypothetical protein|nr:hypothetical protein [Candidatus Methanorudis spinitermitis]
MSTPILTYITKNKDKFNDIYFISTCKSICEKTLQDIGKITGKEHITIMFIDKHDTGSKLDGKEDVFVNSIKN